MNMPYRPWPTLLLAAALSACGGGISLGFFDDDFDDDFFDLRPFSTSRPASVTVSGASDPALDGTYATPDAFVSHVAGFLGNPDTCRFRFDGLREPASGRFMAGEIRYLPQSLLVATSIVVVGVEEFRLDGASGVALDRDNNEVDFAGAVLRSVRGSGQVVTLTGSVPMRAGERPRGC